MNDQKDTAKKPAIDLRKIEEFSEDYANHILFQGSNWDMKLIFGELDQTLGHNVVLQHTAITIPWAQVKLLAYFLSVHLTLHEFQFGRIQLA